ncbi:MAG: hypothetical protein NTV39_03275 [Candidatus Saccharibacteria bacterium]|nr:hypothetical protein [Candidatus Saccharibacteria bacterium]
MEQGVLEKTIQTSAQELLTPMSGTEESHQVEARVFDIEEYRKRRVGREAIKISAEELGYNDTLTYLYRRVVCGDVDYMPDFEAEIAEKLKDINHFENHVFFEPVGGDFVSIRDKVSLTEMTEKNLPRVKEESARTPKLKDEYERAKLENREIGVISEWFKGAEEGEFLIFESLPLMEGEDFAVTRIYQRVGDLLEGSYFSLNNPSIAQFNELRKKFGVETNYHSALEVLGSPYEISNPQLATTSDLIDYYVGIYDGLLSKQNQKNYSFGNETPEGIKNINSFEMVKSQKNLLTVFTKTVEMLAVSEGRVTPEISRVCIDFEISGLYEGQKISSSKAREILEAVSLGVIHSFATVDKKILNQLENSDVGYDASYDTAVHSSNQAIANGDTYDTICPTFGITTEQSASQPGFENSAILQAYGVHDKLGNFGKPKIGVCRIKNCPTRGESKYVHSKTLVGGCDVCVHCHHIFEKGKSPEKIYAEKVKLEQQKQKQDEEERDRLERERVEWEKRKTDRKKRKLVLETQASEKTNPKSFFQQLEEAGKKAA